MNTRNAEARRAASLLRDALEKIETTGSTVLAVIWAGQKLIVMVDKPPAFVRGAMKSRQVATNAVHQTFAAPFHGVQLEWIISTPIVQAVGHA